MKLQMLSNIVSKAKQQGASVNLESYKNIKRVNKTNGCKNKNTKRKAKDKNSWRKRLS